LIALLGNTVTILTVLGPPLAYALISYFELQHRAQEHAAMGARHVEQQLRTAAASTALEDITVGVVHATGGTNNTVAASWITNQDNLVIMFKGTSPRWPELEVSSPIQARRFTGEFHVAYSTERIVMGTLHVALAFLVLGLAAHYCFRQLPFSALDRALEELQASKSELQGRNVRFDTALDHMSQGLCMFDCDQRILIFNRRYAQVYGLPLEQVRTGMTLREIVQLRIANGLYAGASPDAYMGERTARVTQASNTVQQLSDGRFIAIARRPMECGGWVTTHEDITEQRKAEAQIAYMAHHDALTGLPNRSMLRLRLDEALARAQQGEALAVLCLDLDRFKEVNDTLGHAVGDSLLKAVSERLKGCIRDTDTVCRASGDEFVIIQRPVSARAEAKALAKRIVDTLHEPFVLFGHQVMVGSSVGIAMAPEDTTDPEQLLRNADLALYRAKNEQRGTYRFFEPDMNSRLVARRDLEMALRNALQNGEFEVYYQPILNLEHNEVRGFEALLRWHRPEVGTVSPAQFIPLAEETGLITPIGEWVLRQACAQAASWPTHITVSVNLSAVQFKSRNLVQTVLSALASSSIAPGRLELEITESVLVQDSENALEMLRDLRTLGVKIALDDFGTGYSSLSYLQSFPFDKIKIDRSFIKDLEACNENALAIVSAVVQLGRTLGMATTAEGVETSDQMEIVRAKGCTEIQGYLLSPPKPPLQMQQFCVGPYRASSAA
jgi:diguanylate cyclase (GGDEF)-like protein